MWHRTVYTSFLASLVVALATAAPAAAPPTALAAPTRARADLPVVDPRTQPISAPAIRADRIEIRLRPTASQAARAFVARAAVGPAVAGTPTTTNRQLSRLGVASIDRLAASLGGVTFTPEFAGEAAPPNSPNEPLNARPPYDRTDFTSFYIATVPSSTSLDLALQSFRGLADIASASPIAVLPVSTVPNDSLFSTSWWFENPVGRHDVHAPEAWSITTGDTAILVAIVDTGVSLDHPDIAGTPANPYGNIWTNTAEANGTPGVDDDHNGFVDDVHGWDFVALPNGFDATPGEDWQDEDNDPSDFAAHGTQVAGLAAAITNNTIGVAGMNWRASIMPLRIGWAGPGAPLGFVDMAYAAEAIRYATRMGAKVINCSFSTQFTDGLMAAAKAAADTGVLIVMSAGNDDDPFHDLQDREDVLSVTASTREDTVASLSNLGEYVDVMAPGEELASTTVLHLGADSLSVRTPGYIEDVKGTSLAAPIATGVAALVLAQRRATYSRPLRPMELLFRLRETADDVSALNPGKMGYGEGRLNAERAITAPPTSYGVRGLANTVGAPVIVNPPLPVPVFPNVATSASTPPTPTTATLGPDPAWIPYAYAARDSALVFFGIHGDTLRRVQLTAEPFDSPAAADAGGVQGIVVFVTTGDGKVAGFDNFGNPLPGWPQTMETFGETTYPVGPVLGDIDGDGSLDVVAVSPYGHVYAWHLNGTLFAGFPVATSGDAPGPPALSDLDGVAGAEIVLATQDVQNHLYVINRAGTMLTGWPKSTPIGLRAPIVMRLGHDARPVIVTLTSLSMRVYRADGSTVFTKSLGGASPASDVVAADLDGDGADEIVVPLLLPDAVTVFDSTGVQSLSWPRFLPSQITGPPVVRAIAPPDAGASSVIVPRGGKYDVFAADNRLERSYPKPGLAGDTPTLLDAGTVEGERLFTGSGGDSLIYLYRPPFPSLARDPLASWPTARGNFARTASRLYAPSLVTDLGVASVTSTSVVLRWTAIGEQGRGGRPQSYEVRASFNPILTDSAFAQATLSRAVTATVNEGGKESMTFDHLEAQKTYWFAVRARDPNGALSQLSNSPWAETSNGGLPPAGVAIVARPQPSRAPVVFSWRGQAGAAGQKIRIYDLSGRRRRSIDLGTAAFGNAAWDGIDDGGERVEAGIYFVRLTAGSEHADTRIVLLQ